MEPHIIPIKKDRLSRYNKRSFFMLITLLFSDLSGNNYIAHWHFYKRRNPFV